MDSRAIPERIRENDVLCEETSYSEKAYSMIRLKLFSSILVLWIFFLWCPSPTQAAVAPPNPVGNNLIADIVEQRGQSVVNIDVVKLEKQRAFNPFEDFERQFGFQFNTDPEFKRFFEERTVPVKGAGSGFIVDTKDHVLTNEHVIRDADKIKVTLRDGRSFDAEVIGKDASLDIAVLRVKTKENLPNLSLGDSDKIRVGEWVIAIGNPYQFSNTVTVGIVSATGRALDDLGKKNLIQTDAAINPGNSGGPLINMRGEVIGINVAIAAQAQGIGFAIPVNGAKEILGDLLSKGKVSRPWLGVYLREVDQQVASYLELPFTEGVVVTDVAKGSPAERGGIQKYDVILKVEGNKADKAQTIQEQVRKRKPGESIDIDIYREGKRKSLRIRLGEMP